MTIKHYKAPGYNMSFDNDTGATMRWGKTYADDPTMSPLGPEILDIEISTVCGGIGNTWNTRKPCAICYKSNSSVGENMSLETFKVVFSKLTQGTPVGQIAFGIGDIDGNPDLWAIMEHCRAGGVVPNITTNGMGVDDSIAKKLASLCGAVAVSHYHIDDVCFDAVARLTKAGLKQCNIHACLAVETYERCVKLIGKVKSDERLKGLKAVVFLALKQKGDRNRYHSITDLGMYKALFEHAMSKGVSIGMDSCSGPVALKTLPESTHHSVDPCESGLFSLYVSQDAKAYPCSFTEGTPGWEDGIDLTSEAVKSFKDDVWYSPRIVQWRERLLSSSKGCVSCSVQKLCRSCPTYDVTPCRQAACHDDHQHLPVVGGAQ